MTLCVSKDGQHDFLDKRLFFKFLFFFFTGEDKCFRCMLCLLFSYSQWLPCPIGSDNMLQNTPIFFITFQELDCNLYRMLFVQISKVCGKPSCTNFMVPQVIMHYSTCESVDESHMCSNNRQHNMSVFSD